MLGPVLSREELRMESSFDEFVMFLPSWGSYRHRYLPSDLETTYTNHLPKSIR